MERGCLLDVNLMYKLMPVGNAGTSPTCWQREQFWMPLQETVFYLVRRVYFTSTTPAAWLGRICNIRLCRETWPVFISDSMSKEFMDFTSLKIAAKTKAETFGWRFSKNLWSWLWSPLWPVRMALCCLSLSHWPWQQQLVWYNPMRSHRWTSKFGTFWENPWTM